MILQSPERLLRLIHSLAGLSSFLGDADLYSRGHRRHRRRHRHHNHRLRRPFTHLSRKLNDALCVAENLGVALDDTLDWTDDVSGGGIQSGARHLRTEAERVMWECVVMRDTVRMLQHARKYIIS